MRLVNSGCSVRCSGGALCCRHGRAWHGPGMCLLTLLSLPSRSSSWQLHLNYILHAARCLWCCRATARRQLGQLLGAVEDCESALRLEPNNKQAAEDRAACVAALLEQEGLQPPTQSQWLPLVLGSAAGSSSGGGGSGGTVGGAARPAQAAEGTSQPAVPSIKPPAGDDLISVAAVKRLKPEANACTAAEAAKVEPVTTDAAQHASQQGAAEQPAAAVPVAAGGSGGRIADAAIPDSTKQQEARAPAEQQQHAVQQPAAAQQPPGAAPAPVLAAASPPTFKPPRTGAQEHGVHCLGMQWLVKQCTVRRCMIYELLPIASALHAPPSVSSDVHPPLPPLSSPSGLEFEKAWKGLKGDRQLQAAYLLALQASALPALLRQALSPGLLAAATAALLCPGMQQAPAAAVGLLESLTQVPRFDLNLLSVPPKQRAELTANWEAAAAAVQGQAGGDAAALAGRLAAVRQRYKL